MSTLFPQLSPELGSAVDKLLSLIDRAFPLPQRFRKGLPRDVAELSRLLTSERGSRSLSYLGKAPLLSAYLRYYLPWNVFRLCRLLPSLPLTLNSGDAVTDLGSGPLTFVIALWLSRPDLRALPLEFRCVDRSSIALGAGKKLFALLAGTDTRWTIKTIKGDIFSPATPVHGPGAALLSAVNVFNEMGERMPNRRIPQDEVSRIAMLIRKRGACSPSVLVVEPGVPHGGEFISALRSALIEVGLNPRAPCPHAGVCPLPGGIGAKWCHFAFDTLDAPARLHKLSADAHIPKERAVLSFLFAAPAPVQREANAASLRVISDSFPLPDGYGRYGCSDHGLILLYGDRGPVENAASGTLLPLVLPRSPRIDRKSGAMMVLL